MKTSQFFSLFAVLFITLAPTNSSDVVDQICQKTPFYKLCLDSLSTNLQPMSSDVKGLTSAMASLILANATDTLNYIEVQIKQCTEPSLEQPLAYCAELFIPVVRYNIPQAIAALSKGQFGFAGFAIADASKQALNCEKAFLNSAAFSPLTVRNTILSDLCNVAVAIINSFIKKQLG